MDLGRGVTLHTEDFTAEREWTAEGIPVLSASVVLPEPVPAGDKVSRRILRYYQLQCRSYLSYCQNWLFPQAEAEYRAALAASAPLPSFRAELTYRVTYNSGGLWSLYTQSRESMGPGRTLLNRRGDTWDLALGYPVELSRFFPPKTPWKKRLLALAAEEIHRQEAAGVSQYRENWRRLLRSKFNAQNYYLTEEGLAFFFPMLSIAPRAEGIPTFLLPYGEEGAVRPGGQGDPPSPPEDGETRT